MPGKFALLKPLSEEIPAGIPTAGPSNLALGPSWAALLRLDGRGPDSRGTCRESTGPAWKPPWEGSALSLPTSEWAGAGRERPGGPMAQPKAGEEEEGGEVRGGWQEPRPIKICQRLSLVFMTQGPAFMCISLGGSISPAQKGKPRLGSDLSLAPARPDAGAAAQLQRTHPSGSPSPSSAPLGLGWLGVEEMGVPQSPRSSPPPRLPRQTWPAFDQGAPSPRPLSPGHFAFSPHNSPVV